MRFLVDANILLYAVNRSCSEHRPARTFLDRHFADRTPWCITWGIVYEFLRVATHPRVFPAPLAASQAYGFISWLLEPDTVTVLVPTNRHLELLQRTLRELPNPAGSLFHDIATAVLMREHGVREIVTADTDFLQFGFLQVTNPLVSA